ncbi:MAG: ferritin-like domain-containing protein [Betaproteobacteria bacterium]|nr:ferritin-like domain-containing protein [Betaproteobacteria bacterium]
MKTERRTAAAEYEDFMARAYAMELEATERYAQFAEQLDTHNNREVALLFRKLSEIEALHAKRILAEMGWPSVPALTPAFAWEGGEGPETAPFDSLHYLMQPFHALKIALRCELQAQAYFKKIAAGSAPARVRAAAVEMAAEEREHVRLIRDWLKRVPQPTADWDEDPDPPRVTE